MKFNRGKHVSETAIMGTILVIGVLIMAGAIYYIETINPITIGAAVARFQEQALTDNVSVIRHSNEKCYGGNCHDVDFELLIDGKPVQGRCISGTRSPMICSLNDFGD